MTIDDLNILALIPARGGSKGVPRKNIKQLRGKELLRYSIEFGLSCDFLTRVVVSTDDEEIAEVGRKAGAEVPFLRPPELAEDGSPTIDTVIHALDFFQEQEVHFDVVCLLQPTVPFRHPVDLEEALNTFVARDGDSLISVRPVPHVYNPHWVYEQDVATGFLKMATGDTKIIPRRQDLPKAYHRDGSIYLTKTEIIRERRSLYGDRLLHVEMPHSPNINIDTLQDWEAAEKYLATKLGEHA